MIAIADDREERRREARRLRELEWSIAAICRQLQASDKTVRGWVHGVGVGSTPPCETCGEPTPNRGVHGGLCKSCWLESIPGHPHSFDPGPEYVAAIKSRIAMVFEWKQKNGWADAPPAVLDMLFGKP